MAKKTNKNNEVTVECKEGICPLCGEEVTYEGKEDNYDNGGVFRWYCENCGASGKEGYIEAFDGNHYDVEDADGNNITIVAPEKKQDNDVEELLAFLMKGLASPKNAADHYTVKDGRIHCSSEARAWIISEFLREAGIPEGTVVTAPWTPCAPEDSDGKHSFVIMVEHNYTGDNVAKVVGVCDEYWKAQKALHEQFMSEMDNFINREVSPDVHCCERDIEGDKADFLRISCIETTFAEGCSYQHEVYARVSILESVVL